MIRKNNRICIRYSDEEASMLAELRGYRYLYQQGQIFRQALRELHRKMRAEKTDYVERKLGPIMPPDPAYDTDAPALAAALAGDGIDPAVLEVTPPAAHDKEPPPAKVTPKRRAPGPKTGDNHRPKKGVNNARTSDGRKRPPGGRQGSAAKGRPRKAANG